MLGGSLERDGRCFEGFQQTWLLHAVSDGKVDCPYEVPSGLLRTGVEKWRLNGVEEWRLNGVEEWRLNGVEEWRLDDVEDEGWFE